MTIEAPRSPTEVIATLEQCHARSTIDELEGRGDSCETATDDRDVWLVTGAHAPAPARLRIATHAFSQVGSETRRSITASGSLSIRFKSRR